MTSHPMAKGLCDDSTVVRVGPYVEATNVAFGSIKLCKNANLV